VANDIQEEAVLVLSLNGSIYICNKTEDNVVRKSGKETGQNAITGAILTCGTHTTNKITAKQK
jgi:hypothetical protein